MGRFVRAGFIMIGGLMFYPFIKGFYDTYTNATNGSILFYANGTIRPTALLSNDALALAGAIPWICPLIAFIVAVIIIVKPENPPDERPPQE